MIDEEKTFAEFGYRSDSLTHGSDKKIIVICNSCGKERILRFSSYRDLCFSCSMTGERNHNWKGGERLADRRSKLKRRKHLDPNPIDLNKYFKGSHGHHINVKYIIYIPAKMHRSIRHTQITGEGMQKMNKLAFEYLFKTIDLKPLLN